VLGVGCVTINRFRDTLAAGVFEFVYFLSRLTLQLSFPSYTNRSKMAYTNDEVKPLMGSRNNDVNIIGAPRRRMAPEKPQQSSQQQQYYSSGTMEDFTKKTDRRACLSKCCASINRCLCARPKVDGTSEYYEDTFNDEPWECTFGTGDEDGIWVNCGDKVGQIMSSMVWVLFLYSALTISLLAQKRCHGLCHHLCIGVGISL
jgi:hypothetical protein